MVYLLADRLSINQARRRATTLIETNTLPISHAIT